ncbi:amino acid adenylation domain-containing protein [Chitinophaga oryzae]|uniref:Amino acid adenylation domain-containing protein n=1 Tax=Chitinophaga oryzae TaxID=2725414 RepID=A0ABX6LE33_9BACT|nr:non-ribosomal peptide synthetase [Chitinophaga oryzae]QJB38092.1 amino acid adenylation domain-containing protein [Chitinophaga oryzae]
MRIADFIIALKEQQITLEVTEGNLKVAAPKGSNVLTEELKQQIREQKEAIIAFFKMAEGSSQALNIPVVAPGGHYPMSRAQKRFWALNQSGEGGLVYNMCRSLVLEGPLEAPVLEQALRYVISRHESLRTCFREQEDGEVRQHILAPEEIPAVMEYIDISARSAPQEILRTMAEKEQNTPFDLRKSPPLRVKLVKVHDGLHAFFYSMFHIISDGWSMEVLAKEVIIAYNLFRQGQQPRLPELAFQYKDYTAWLETQLQNDLKKAETYWLTQLSGDLPVLDLPADNIRPAVKTSNGASVFIRFSPSLTAGLNKLCREEGATLFTGLLAGINALFHRYTGQEDIIMGLPVAGRDFTELENQIGLYLNTLALRTRFSGSDTFRELVRRQRQVLTAAYDHQLYPLDMLLDKLPLDRDMSRSPLFDVLVVSQINEQAGAGEGITSLDGLQVKTMEKAEGDISEYDLLFNFTMAGDNVSLSLTYNTDIFSRRNIDVLCRHLEQLLAAAIAQPAAEVALLDYLLPDEKEALLVSLNKTQVRYPETETIVSLFEKQAVQTPARIAVDDGELPLTYEELNERANRLAHFLQKEKGIGREVAVGLLMNKTAHTIIAILGILKAGGAYVPIDPSFPEERQQYILDDAKISLVLSDGHTCATPAECIDITAIGFDAYPDINPPAVATASGLAYVIYTSGTTGQPKGVMITHRNVVRLFFHEESLFAFTENDVWTMLHSYNFDFSVWEMYGALFYGGRLIVVPTEVARDSYRCWQLIREKGVTILNQTPSAFYQLMHVAMEDEYEIKALRCVIFGGEALLPARLAAWKHAYPGVKLINMYGITETTVHTTYKEITIAETSMPASNIGVPIPTVGVYILDARQQLMPVGVPGELCVCGAGLARGYMNNPVLTQEKFIPDPFSPGGLLYRSGDIGRWLPDGNIEYIGRKDHQVKVRGYRIETGEVETALLRHEKVKSALVIAQPEPGGNSHALVAYITAEETLDGRILKQYLSGILPEYMVPAWFVQLEAFPLTANGKTDRKALPDPVKAGLSGNDNYIAPQTTAEKQLAKIWEEVLGREGIGVLDNFFELGGHSLAAMQVISRVHRGMKVQIGLKHFFEHPVLQSLAAWIAGSSRSEQEDIVPAPPAAAYDLSFAQRSIWMLSQFEERKVAYNISSVLQFDGDLDIRAFESCLDLLVVRHESLRTTFLETGGTPMQKIHPAIPGWLGAIYADLRTEPEQEKAVDLIKKQEVGKSFDLVRGPLVSVRLLHLEDQRFMLMFTIHHLVCDGWSLNLLMEETAVLYNACRLKQQSPLPPLRLQYKDYACWEKKQLESSRLSEARAFWLRHFEGGIKPVSLHGGKSVSASRNFKGASHTFRLEAHLKQGLESLARKYNVTLYPLMLCVFNVFLSRISKEEDITVLCASAGREHTDLENILGVFVKTFGIRNFPEGDKPFADFLSEVMKRYLDVVHYNYYPFEHLLNDLEKVQQSRNIGNVYFQIDNFSSFETRQPKQGMEGVNISPVFNGADTSKADLMLYITQNPEDWYVTFEFKTDLFTAGKINLWAAWLRRLIAGIIAAPQQPIGAYQLSDGHDPELFALMEASTDDISLLYPLSARQEDFYLNCKILPRETAHRVIFYAVEEYLDVRLWKEAIGVVNEIYPILTTRLAEQEGEVYQGLRKHLTLNTEEIDLSALQLREEDLKDRLGAYVTLDHGLDKELVKYFLIKINDRCYVNLISIHHLISDVTSSVLFFRMFEKVYGKRREEIPAELFNQYQYHDYVANNPRQFDTTAITEYWKLKLRDVEPVPVNVYDEVPEESMEETLVLPAEHMAGISRFCVEHHISEALYFRALYSLMVRLYAVPQGQFIINDITHGRDALTKETFGCFTAILPLVYDASAFAGSVAEYLMYLRHQKKEIAGRQFITVFQLNRLISTSGLKFYYNYQTLYTIKEGSDKLVKVLAYFAKDEVQFSIRNTAAGQTLILNYNKAYFRANGFLDRLMMVSEQFLSGVGTLSDINMLLPAEQALLNPVRPVAAAAAWMPVSRLIARQAQLTPDAIALSCDGRNRSYGEMERQATALAAWLLQQPVAPGDLLAVMTDRSAEMVIALLAVLKSGAAYVPIDPAYPAERIAHICSDAAVKVILTTSMLLADIPPAFNGGVFALDIQLEGLPDADASLLPDVAPDDTAYVIYTSGSTGKPKGCLVSHHNLHNYISWANDYYWQDAGAGNWGLCTSIAFDLTVTAIYTALTRGRTLYLATGDQMPALIQACFTTPDIDTLKLTPSHIALAGTLAIDTTAVSTVICGGEQLMPEHVDILLRMNPGMKIYNEYGPTETTVGCTVKKITAADRDISVGKPVAHTEILIMNEDKRLVPPGMPGEIYIAGAGVAKGYLNNSALTAEKFMPHPWMQGQRMYRTGDTGRWLPDGNLLYTGRKDRQVKIRGYRIELDEIETVLLEHPGVTAATVLAMPEKDGGAYLAAFYVAEESLPADVLRGFLTGRLPDYMLPSAYAQLEQMPLTVHGKVDHKQLPVFLEASLAGRREYVAPTGDTEEKLAVIWEEVLGQERVSATDSFFEIGGHSLKAMQVVSRIHKEFDVEMELGQLFEMPVLSTLAAYIHQETWLRNAPDESAGAFKEIKI